MDDEDHNKLLKEANDLMKSFLLGGLRVKEDDSGSLVSEVQKIFELTVEERREAVRGYLTTQDMDAFIAALLPIQKSIFYDAYGPYWLSHCHPVVDSDDVVEFTFYNDLIDMFWAAKWQEWKKKGEWCVTIMLPPTKGLMALQRNL